MFLRKTSAVLCLSLMSIGCWGLDLNSENNKQVETTEDANSAVVTDLNKPIIVMANSPNFSIRLSANPTTGYQWYLVSYNSELVKLIGRDYVQGESRPIVGAPTVDVWKFQLKKAAFIAPQVMRITLEQRRAWEVQALKRESFTIISEVVGKKKG